MGSAPKPRAPFEDHPIAAAFVAVLHERGVLPLRSTAPWLSYTLDHGIPSPVVGGRLDLGPFRQALPNAIRGVAGVYVYRVGTEVLYVGKGNPVSERLSNHYRWSYDQPKAKEDGGESRFFPKYRTKVEVLVLPLDNERERRAVEALLQEVLRPLFDQMPKLPRPTSGARA